MTPSLAQTPLDPATAVLPVGGSRGGAVTDLATRHLRGVSSLLQARADLRGVSAFADVVEESVRWTA